MTGYEKACRAIGQELEAAFAAIVERVARGNVAPTCGTGTLTDQELVEFLTSISAAQLSLNFLPRTQVASGVRYSAYGISVPNPASAEQETANIGVSATVNW